MDSECGKCFSQCLLDEISETGNYKTIYDYSDGGSLDTHRLVTHTSDEARFTD